MNLAGPNRRFALSLAYWEEGVVVVDHFVDFRSGFGGVDGFGGSTECFSSGQSNHGADRFGGACAITGL